MPRGASEVERHRDGSGSDDSIRHFLTELTKPLEQDIPPERDAGEHKRRVEIVGKQSPRDRVNISSLAGVVEPRSAVWLSAATAEDQQIS